MVHKGSPTVILAKTIKGYGLGEAGEGRNVTHQQKKLNEQELRHFRSRFGIPIPDSAIKDTPFYRPAPDSEEMQYLQQQRRKLGGYLPSRSESVPIFRPPDDSFYKELLTGSGDREVATTLVMVHLLGKLLADKKNRPIYRSDRTGRSPHFRDGIPVSQIRYLLACRTAI
jgi:pyruvate dehydrogenase E1 component